MVKTVIFTLLTCNLLLAKALVYQVSAPNGHTIFLGGTIHVLSNNDYPLNPEYAYAYDGSNNIYVETDLEATNEAAFGQLLVANLAYPNGKTLRDDLTRSTYMRLKKYPTHP